MQRPAHPWGQYPYAYRPPVDPRYVGPQWAAPGPRVPLPPRASGPSGCLIAGIVAAVFFVFIGIPFVIFIGIGIFAVATSDGTAPTATTSPTYTSTPTSTPTGKPTALPTAPVATVATPSVKNAETTGSCTEVNSERLETTYQARRDDGSAPRLRGRVAVIHIRMGGGEASWPTTLKVRIDEAAMVSRDFYAEQARRRGIKDLKIDMIPWSLTSAPMVVPTLIPNRANNLDVTVQRELKVNAKRAVELSTGSSMDSVVASYRAKGYDAVAFLVYLPQSTTARDFAWYAAKTDPTNDPEVAIIFPKRDELLHLSVAVAHEALHLFGAYDLYRLRDTDPGDKHDIMGDYCNGFRQTTLGDATAYGIGWTNTPPDRPYRFVDW